MDLSYLMILVMIALPLISGVVLCFCKKTIVRWVLWLEIGFLLIGLGVLGWLGERHIYPGLSFVGEPITFSVSSTPVLLFAVVLFVLAVIYLQHQAAKKESIAKYQAVLISVALSSGVVAFFSGQFMIRYVALDIVGLAAALTVLSSFRDFSPLKDFILIFQVLRLGDLSLLSSILLIYHYAGTLDITEMIATASGLPLAAQTWVYFGFIFALLIKLAIWPFGIWLQKAHRNVNSMSFWISGILTPALGYYLLYRITPIITGYTFFIDFTLILGFTLICLLLLIDFLQLVEIDRFTRISGLSSCFLLIAVAIGADTYLVVYLVSLVVYRLVVVLQEELNSPAVEYGLFIIPIMLNGLLLVLNLPQFHPTVSVFWILFTLVVSTWDLWVDRREMFTEQVPILQFQTVSSGADREHLLVRIAQWLNMTLELDFFQNGVLRVSGFLGGIARWVNRNIEMRLDNFWSFLGDKLLLASETTWHTVEVGAAERTGEIMGDALKSLEAHERNVLKRSLRWDLAWIPLLLAVILVMLFVV